MRRKNSHSAPLASTPAFRLGLPPLTRRNALGGAVAALCAATVPVFAMRQPFAGSTPLPRTDSTRLVCDLLEMPIGGPN